MEELFSAVLVFFNHGIAQGHFNGIFAVFVGVSIVAIVSYLIYRLAVISLKLGAVGIVIYLVMTMTNMINTNIETKSARISVSNLNIEALKKQINSILNGPSAISIPLLHELLNNDK